MKTPDNKNKNLPAELDTELQNLSDSEIQGLSEVWDLTGSSPSSDFPNHDKLDQIWLAVEKNMASESSTAKIEPERDRPAVKNVNKARLYSMRWLAAAAVLIIGMVGARLWFSPVTVSVPYGETASLQLSDGSTIELNSGSSIRYARSFGDTRKVTLQGEAYFDVQKEERPFIVETFNSSVQVLGTSFNVKAWDNESKTVVALKSGSVEVTGLNDLAESVRLVAGQTAKVQREEIVLSPMEDGLLSVSLAWISGDFAYAEEAFSAVLQDIERRYDTEILLSPSSLGSRKTKYNRKSPDSAQVVLEELCTSLGLAFRSTDSGFEVYDPQ